MAADSRLKIFAPMLMLGGAVIAALGIFKPRFVWESWRGSRMVNTYGDSGLAIVFIVAGLAMIAVGGYLLIKQRQ